MPPISAIIVTRNNRKDIGRTLESLRRSGRPVSQIVVADNGSTDDTQDFIRRHFPDVELIEFWDNPGFGEGNNRGARVATGDYLLLLNPDATVAPDCLDHLVGQLEADPQAGIAAPKVVLASEPTIINSAGLSVNEIGYGWDRGYLEWDTGQYDRPERILGGSGCALLIRAEVFRALGGFDAPYFLYYEDLDLCWRSWIIGRPVRYVPAAVVQHAMKVSNRPMFYDECLDHRNRLRTLIKNFSPGSWKRIGRDVLSFEAGSVWDRIRRRQWRHVRYRLQAWTWNLRHVRDTWSRRRSVQRQRGIGDEAIAPLFAPGRSWPRVRAALPQYREAYDHSVDPGQLAERLVMGTNDVGALGLGWYGVDSYAGVPSRWCCGYGIAFLRAPEARDGARLAIQFSASRPTDLVVRTDREERRRFTVNPGAGQHIDMPVPIHGAVVRVELLVTDPFVPAELDPASPDDRTLGIAVACIALAD